MEENGSRERTSGINNLENEKCIHADDRSEPAQKYP